MDYRIRQYILENRERYTRAAIVATLIKYGYDRAVIEQTWDQLEQEYPVYIRVAGKSKPSAAYLRFWLAGLGVFLGVPGIYILITYILDRTTFGSTVGPVFLIGAFIGLIVGISVTRERDLPVSQGLVTGLIGLVLLPFIGIVIILGICISGNYRI